MGTEHEVPSDDASLAGRLAARRNFDEAAIRLAEQGRFVMGKEASETEMLERATEMTDQPDPRSSGPKP